MLSYEKIVYWKTKVMKKGAERGEKESNTEKPNCAAVRTNKMVWQTCWSADFFKTQISHCWKGIIEIIDSY